MAAALETLAIGDRVVVRRILDPDPEVVEVVGTSTVMDRREIPAIAGSGSWPRREAKTLVRLPSGSWYDCATGLQHDSAAS